MSEREHGREGYCKGRVAFAASRSFSFFLPLFLFLLLSCFFLVQAVAGTRFPCVPDQVLMTSFVFGLTTLSLPHQSPKGVPAFTLELPSVAARAPREKEEDMGGLHDASVSAEERACPCFRSASSCQKKLQFF